MKELEWTRFSGKRGRGDVSFISLLRTGRLGCSSAFMQKYNLGKYSYAALNYAEDEDYMYIGIIFAHKRDELKGALKITFPKNNYGLIEAKSFFKKFGIDANKYTDKYDVKQIRHRTMGEMYIVEIKK